MVARLALNTNAFASSGNVEWRLRSGTESDTHVAVDGETSAFGDEPNTAPSANGELVRRRGRERNEIAIAPDKSSGMNGVRVGAGGKAVGTAGHVAVTAGDRGEPCVGADGVEEAAADRR